MLENNLDYITKNTATIKFIHFFCFFRNAKLFCGPCIMFANYQTMVGCIWINQEITLSQSLKKITKITYGNCNSSFSHKNDGATSHTMLHVGTKECQRYFLRVRSPNEMSHHTQLGGLWWKEFDSKLIFWKKYSDSNLSSPFQK